MEVHMNYSPNPTRYNSMKYRNAGNSGLKLPLVSLGFWHNFGNHNTLQSMKDLCFTAFDNGITHFDLANNYGSEHGTAERNLGRIITEDLHSYRDELVISTKAGFEIWPGPYGHGGSRKYLSLCIDRSLDRMGLDYVDIFYHQCMDRETPLEETMSALDQIAKSGKALYIGLSNYDSDTLKKASAILKDLKCPYVVNQNRYSIFDRSIDNNGVKKATAQEGKGLIVYSPLEQGLLSGKYLDGMIPADSRMASDSPFLTEDSLTADMLTRLNKLNEVAALRGQSLSQLAISWALRDETVASVVIGASKPEQIIDNVRAINQINLNPRDLTLIDQLAGV
jgi:L-glyceraldehyde 3-phosphate reductase